MPRSLPLSVISVRSARLVASGAELKEINPNYSFSEHYGRLPFKRKEDVRRIAEGIAKAGLPTSRPTSFPKSTA